MKCRRVAIAGLLLLMTLCALCSSLPSSAQKAPISAERIKSDTARVLSGSEYQKFRPRVTWLQRVGGWITDELGVFLRWLARLAIPMNNRAAPANPIMAWALLLLFILLAVALLYYLVRLYLLSDRRPWLRQRFHKTSNEEEPLDNAAAETAPWLLRAQQYAARGDFANAYRAAFLAILMRLDRLGLIQYDPSRTNGEYVRALRGKGDLASFMRGLAREFDIRTYGGAEVTEEDYRKCTQAYEYVDRYSLPS